MVTRIFREFVWTLSVAPGTEDVHDISGIMQDIAPRKGFKVLQIHGTVSCSAAAATDDSAAFVNLNKNISEAAHHIGPDADGEYTEAQVDGVIVSKTFQFHTGIQGAVINFEHTPTKPIVFDANDRLNVELTGNNKDVASQDFIYRVFLDIEIA
ncbi:unnamed protein product [marine sediment metagenome]|uniref:Uncharacterized protein n=1 Tax=marine sediment metagenome TaxID=412755 RepID=X1NDD9_9ZZZZ